MVPPWTSHHKELGGQPGALRLGQPGALRLPCIVSSFLSPPPFLTPLPSLCFLSLLTHLPTPAGVGSADFCRRTRLPLT